MRNTARLATILFFFAAVSPGQEGTASRPDEVNLPVTEFAKPVQLGDTVVVVVSRAGTPEAATRPTTIFDAWRISIYNQTFPFDKTGMGRLVEKLRALAAVRPGKTKEAPSERRLLIKGDAEAPYGFTQKVLEAAAAAKIYKTSIAAVSEPGAAPGAFDMWLPRDKGRAQAGPTAREGAETRDDEGRDEPEIRVILSWNRTAGRLERIFGQSLIPATAEGNQRLDRLLSESWKQYKKVGRRDVPLIIDAGPAVPWKHVVEVLDAGMRAGILKIEFSSGTALEK
jgi:biopolymer transport protein ExbD